MLFAVFAVFGLADSVVACENISENCEQCLGLGREVPCGWCSDSGSCLAGTEEGPTSGSCQKWKFQFDMKCHLESIPEASLGVRIGVTVFASTVAVGTAVFWVCIFPHCAAPAKRTRDEEEDAESE